MRVKDQTKCIVQRNQIVKELISMAMEKQESRRLRQIMICTSNYMYRFSNLLVKDSFIINLSSISQPTDYDFYLDCNA